MSPEKMLVRDGWLIGIFQIVFLGDNPARFCVIGASTKSRDGAMEQAGHAGAGKKRRHCCI